MENKASIEELCFICCKTNKSKRTWHSESEILPSQKTIKEICIHILNATNKHDLKLPRDIWVCNKCYHVLVEYDDFLQRLLRIQQRLALMIQESRVIQEFKKEPEVCVSIKQEAVVDFNEAERKDMLIDEQIYDEQDSFIEKGLDEQMLDGEIVIDQYSDESEGRDVAELLKARKARIQQQCALCNKVCKTKKELKDHINTEHKRKDKRKCLICGVIAKDEEYLDLHQNIHEGKTEMECRYCAKKYTRKKSVIRHMQKHWDKKNLQCERCGLRFSETVLLYNHRLQHEGEEQPLICTICNQAFKTKRTLKGHLITHRKDRPRFNCEYCSKTFVEKYTRDIHQRIHEGKSNLPKKRSKNKDSPNKDNLNCIICGSNFAIQEDHKNHMEQEHDVILKVDNQL